MTVLLFSQALEQYGNLLYEGAVVEVAGKLSFTENKEPELVCNAMSVPADPTSLGAPAEKPVRPGLYLWFSSKEDPRYRKALQYIAIFDGVSDLYVSFQDTGKLLRAPGKYRVDVNRPLLGALVAL